MSRVFVAPSAFCTVVEGISVVTCAPVSPSWAEGSEVWHTRRWCCRLGATVLQMQEFVATGVERMIRGVRDIHSSRYGRGIE